MSDQLSSFIRDVPDFPQPGIVFKDITPLLENPAGFRMTLDAFTELLKEERIDKIVGIESRGFLFGAPLADRLGAGFVMARKKDKLPGDTIAITYDLEYGTNTIEIHNDSVLPGERVMIVDDVLATGGTASAVCRLVEQLGGEIAGLAFLIELGFLDGRKALEGRKVTRLIEY